MAKRLWYFRLYTLAFIIFYFGGARTSPAEDKLTDMEEYAVLAAVLFPEEGATSAQDSVPDARPSRLEGITGNYYRLSSITIEGTADKGKESDQEMIDDYNYKNRQAHRLDEEKLQAFIPEGGHIVLIDPDERRPAEEGIVTSSGITYISRPGFNKAKTMAIVQINHAAGPEMGVGYLVYMDKTPATGAWLISAFDMNRMY